jgi:hypothetical protein
MSKTKKTKAPLDTKREELFWKERAAAKAQLTLHLTTGEKVSGAVLFATEETIGLETPEGQTRLVSREELTYLEDSAVAVHE